jgi:hypothetical protein
LSFIDCLLNEFFLSIFLFLKVDLVQHLKR